MDNQLEKMIKMLKLWLRKNELDTDTKFYTIEEWKERLEIYHNDAELVIVTEGGLNFILNYGDSDEFYDLIASFGYFCELGHSWNLGFYKDESVANKKIGANQSYLDKLRDTRWLKKRNIVLERANRQCEECYKKSTLEIHHCYYMFGFEPWEYPLDALKCLCSDCHKKRGKIEQVLRSHLAPLKTNELESLITQIKSKF